MQSMDIKVNIARANSINNYSITDFCNNIDECDENMAEKVEMFNEELTLYLPARKRCARFVEYANLKVWIYIITVATIAGWTGISQDYIATVLFGKYRGIWAKSLSSNQFIKFLIWWGWLLFFALCSTTILGLLAPTAAGSGVPPLKSVLGGVHIYKFLHWKILVAKYFGLVGTLLSGVGSGKEGPMIHMSAMICYNIGYLPFYKDIISDPYRKKMLLNAAVACGVTSTFGAPYGAMIFSIELCSTIFLVSNLWKLFVTATVVKIMYDIGFYNEMVVNIKSNFIWPEDQKWHNFPHFIVLGIIGGWMASLWIFCFSQFLQVKGKIPWAFVKNRYFYVLMMSIVICLLQFWVPTAWAGNKGLLNAMWEFDELDEGKPGLFPPNKVWETLLWSVLTRWLMIMCFATMPIPAGIALPSITQGAFIGRFYGEILRWYQPSVKPQAFSIVGASSFGGVMTRCTSISLLLVELTGQIPLVIGIVTANMFSYAIANLFTMSAFNTAMTINKMPYLPFMYYSALYKRRVGDFMDPQSDVMAEKGKLCDVLEFFASRELYQNDEFVPIVETLDNNKIIGSVRSWNILEYIKLVADAIVEEVKEGNAQDLVDKFNAKINVQGNDSNLGGNDRFMLMAMRLKEWVNSIRANEAKLEFSAAGLTTVGGNTGSALSESWLTAFALCRDRAREKAEGVADTQVTERNEYYCFTKVVLNKMNPDWDNPVIKFNSLPICVDANTKLIKVHFLFQMLGVHAVYIAKRGKFQGKLTLEKFLNLRYTEQSYM